MDKRSNEVLNRIVLKSAVESGRWLVVKVAYAVIDGRVSELTSTTVKVAGIIINIADLEICAEASSAMDH